MLTPADQSLISRGIMPRPDFVPCGFCEMQSTCRAARHCAGPSPAQMAEMAPPEPLPIAMVLHCPACGLQHIDEPGEHREIRGGELCIDQWDDQPHRSHLCKPADGGCGYVWRPADVATRGVPETMTKGKNDSPVVAPARVDRCRGTISISTPVPPIRNRAQRRA